MARRLTFRLDGRPEDKGLVRAGAFRAFLDALIKGLRSVEADVGAANTNVLRISRLAASSAIIELEVASKPNMPDRSASVATTFSAGLLALQAGGDPPRALGPRTLRRIGALAKPLGDSVTAIEFTDDEGRHTEVTEAVERRLAVLLGLERAELGEIYGFCEGVNVHQDLLFFVYPVVGPVRVQCHFASELLDTVRQALKRYVTVRGRMLFRPKQPHPFRVDVDELVIHPDEHSLPSLLDLVGAAPNLTGGLSTREYLALFRRGKA